MSDATPEKTLFEFEGALHSTPACLKCGALAAYASFGHMYEFRCDACGYSEAGTFSPGDLAMPRAAYGEVRVNLGDAPPSAAGLHALSKLCPAFGRLRPAELKALYLSGPVLSLGAMYKSDAERVQKAVAGTGFVVQCEWDV